MQAPESSHCDMRRKLDETIGLNTAGRRQHSKRPQYELVTG